jgi:acyl-CoA synthetase (AMP-forming)/AMP-acid ligase II/Na+/melibiose symporter-like transporter
LGTGVFSTVPTVLLLYYCTETLAVPAALAAVAVFLPKAWSILWDPVVGAWSDCAHTPFGRRRPFLLAGAVGVFAAFVALFNAPALAPLQAFGWVALSYFALATLYSLFAVPYVALPSELGSSPAMRSMLVSSRITVATIGVLAGAALAPMLVEHFGGGRAGYASMSWVLAAASLLAMLGPIFVLAGRDAHPVVVRTSSFLSQFTAAARNRELRFLSASYILQIGASGAFSAMVPYIVTRVAGRSEGEIGIALGLMLLTAIGATPLWGWAGRVFGETRVNAVALVLYAITLVGLGAACLTQQPWPALLVLFAAVGAPFAATQVLPFVIQAHIAHKASSFGAGSVEGAYAGAWTAVEKLGLAIGPMLAGLALSIMGSDLAADAPLFIALVPPALLLASIAPLAATGSNTELPMLHPRDVRRIDEFISYYAHTSPDIAACVLDQQRISYRALQQKVDRLARALLAHGIKRGDRVATLTPPNPDYLISFLATTSIGAIWVGLNPRYRIDELKYVLNDSEPRILLTRTRVEGRAYDDEIRALTAGAPSLEWVVAPDSAVSGATELDVFLGAGERISAAQLSAAREAVGGRDPCLLIYTSGSTGRPKGALLHHHGIARFSVRQNEIWPIHPLNTLNYFPVNHAGCITDITVPTLAAGGTIVFMEQFDPARSMELMERERVSLWGSVPSVFQMQLALPDFERYDLSAVQLIAWSGAAAPEPLIKQLRKLNSRLATNYGMSETMVSTALRPTNDLDALANSVGRAFPGVEIRLVLADGGDAPEGEPGEIWVRSEYNLACYWRNPEATAASITEDGFFKTGDLAIKRPDGKYKIVGRIKEMYKSGGYNVYPREVEAVIEDHSNVSAAAVVAAPDPVWQEVGVAYVTPSGELDLADLERHCRERLANYKIPKRFVVEANMPLLPIGKIDKISLKARAARGE